LRRRALGGSSFCVAISQFTRDIALREFPNLKDVRVCLLGLPPWEQPTGPVPEAPPAFKGRKVLLIVARMPAEISKGHRMLLESLCEVRRCVPNVLLCVAGRGSDEPALRAHARRLGVEDLVHWAGYVPEDELIRYFANCDAFVMPSDAEGFGLVYLMAMAWRKACVGGAKGAAREIIVPGETGFLVEKDDVDSLTRHIRRLLTNDADRLALGDAGRRRVEQVFTHSQFRERLVQALLGQPPIPEAEAEYEK
jgi:glycosyltransferase involved in cell wall biosynthesis